MRRLVLMFIVGLAALILVPHAAEAKGVKLTKQQVETVCDGEQSCVRDCGLKNDHLCSFTCKNDKCSGLCESCPGKSSRPFPNHYSKHVVRQAVRRAP